MRSFALIIVNLIIFLSIDPLFAVPTILLRNGEALQGNITNQDSESLSMETVEGKKLVIPKEKLLKVIYKDVNEEERELIRKEEEEKLALLEKKKEEERQRKRLQWEEEQKKKEEERLAEIQKLEESISQKKANIERADTSSEGWKKYFTSYNLATSIKESNLRIAPANSSCKPYAESSDWYWMFGTFPITKPDTKKILPPGENSIHIKAKNSWTDLGVSMVLGILGTVTRRTIVVETCGNQSTGRLYSEEELQLELQKQKLLLESKFGKEKEELLFKE